MTDRQTRQNKALDRLHTNVAKMLNSDTWKAALDFRRRLQHPYSFGNLLLIQEQNPEATMVAGFKKWQTVNRQVRKGEKGIMILAPLIGKDKEDPEKKVVYGFRTAYVFDISQTDGEDVPRLPAPKLLEGQDDAATEAVRLMESLISERGWKLEEREYDNGVRGSWAPDTQTITVDSTLAPLQRAKTLAHEMAHAEFAHSAEYDRQLAELEAETAAYLVMDALGLPTDDYSFAYLAGWTGDAAALDSLLRAGQSACKVADTIFEGLSTAHTPAIAADAA